MTVELDRDDLVNLIIGCSGPYYTIMDKYNEKGLNLGHYVGGFIDSWRRLMKIRVVNTQPKQLGMQQLCFTQINTEKERRQKNEFLVWCYSWHTQYVYYI